MFDLPKVTLKIIKNPFASLKLLKGRRQAKILPNCIVFCEEHKESWQNH